MEERAKNCISIAILIIIMTAYSVFSIPTIPNLLHASKERYINVHGEAPVAMIKVNGELVNEKNLFVTAGSLLELDGSCSYDPDGKIRTYEWLIGREEKYGRRIKVKFDSPSIYPVILFVYDDSTPYSRVGSAIAFIHVLPSELYLCKEGLSERKPEADREKVSFFGKISLYYPIRLNESINVSSIEIFLHLKKPLLSIIRKISVYYMDSEKRMHLIGERKGWGLWMDKVFVFKGNLDNDLMGIEIVLYGFSLRGVSVVYGGDQPSMIKLYQKQYLS